MLLLVPVTLIDLDHRIIPNKLTYPGAVLGVVLVALLVDPDDARGAPDRRRRARAASCSSPRSPTRAGMGMGDVKLALVLGLFLGPRRRRRRCSSR